MRCIRGALERDAMVTPVSCRRPRRQRTEGSLCVDQNVRSNDRPLHALRRRGLRQEKHVERKSYHHVHGRPSVARLPPSDRLESWRTKRPTNGAGKSRDQGDAGDRLAGAVAVDPAARMTLDAERTSRPFGIGPRKTAPALDALRPFLGLPLGGTARIDNLHGDRGSSVT